MQMLFSYLMINPRQTIISPIIRNEEIWLESYCDWIVMSPIRYTGGDSVTQPPEMFTSLPISCPGQLSARDNLQLVCNVIKT